MAPRRRTIVLGTAAALLSLLVLLVGGVVGLTMTERGMGLMVRAVLPAVRRLVPGTLYVGAVRGNLFTDITIDTLELTAPDGTPFLSSGPIRVTYDPRDLLDSRIVVKSLEVTRPRLTLVDYGNDDWNLWRALGRRTKRALPQRRSRLGQYIVIDTTSIHELTFVTRQPWIPNDTLRGVVRDSVIAEHLRRITDEFRREDGRLVKVMRFVRGSLELGRSRIADPDSAGLRLAIRRLDVVWMSPPLWFKDLRGQARLIKDTLWMDSVQFALPKSTARGEAKVIWGSGLPMRYDIRLKSDSVAMTDLAWIDATIPHSGGGRMDLTIRNDPRKLSILDYIITNMDVRSLKSRIKGNMTWGVGGPTVRLTNVDLALQPAHTDLLTWFNGEPFPYDWRGALVGTVKGRGGFLRDWRLDDANFRFADEHVPGAITRGRATGMLDIFQPAEAILKGVDLTIDQLDLRTPRFVNPLFPEISGLVTGTIRLDSLWYDARFSQADIALIDGPGQPSRFTGSGHYTLVPDGTWFDVDMQALPLSYTTMSRSYPNMPLRGEAVGRIRAKGMAEQFDLQATLSGEGGQLSFTGTADALEPTMGANGTWAVRGGNLQSLFGDGRLPTSTLNLSGTVALRGTVDLITGEFINNTVVGPLRATVDQFSRVADTRLFGGGVMVAFDSGRVRIDTLMLESSAFRLLARGGIGLDQAKRDSLRLTVAIDSLGGLRPWFASTDSTKRPFVLPGDTLRGMVELSAILSGSIDTLDRQGLHLDLRTDLRDVVVASSHMRRGTVTAQVRDVLRGANGLAGFTADSALLGGIDIASAAGRTTLTGGLAERFGVTMRTPSESRLALAGGVTRRADTTDVRFDTILVRVDSGLMARPRGFSLVAPATLRIAGRAQGSLDSLVLQHTDTGRIDLRGAFADSGAVTVRLNADRVPLGDIGHLLRTSGLSRGSATASLSVNGTREHPTMDGVVDLWDAVVGRVRFGDLFARAHYDSRHLALAGELRIDGKPALSASASLPLDLALVSGRQRRLNAPLAGQMVSQRTDLAVLQSLFPDVTRARGSLDTDVKLTGTWERPRLRGQLTVDHGSLFLENLGIRLENATADIGLAGDTIVIRRVGATSGLAADSLGVSGVVAITEISKPSFDLRLAANNFLAIDKPRTASLTISTPTPITLTGSSESPRVRGAVRIDRGRVYIQQLAQRRALELSDVDLVDTARFGMNALLPSAPSTLVRNLQVDDVRIGIGDDVWLRSPEANLKLGGQLRVTRGLSRDGVARLALSDSLTVDRGTYQLNLGIARPGFAVERGLVRFFGDPDLEPSLDITALHTVRETRANSNRQDVRIRVNIGGTVNRPTLALTSADNPPLPESDMLSYLVTGEPAYSLLGTPYAEQGATLALRLAGSYLSSRLAGGRFDVVQVEPTALAPGDAANLRQNGLGILASTRVGVGGQVARNTFLTVSTGLCGLSQQTSGSGDALSLFAQGLGVKLERRFDQGLSVALGLEPGSSAQACGRLGMSRTFQQTPPQVGIDFFRFWTF
jgi:translocation and assembly module TamB